VLLLDYDLDNKMAFFAVGMLINVSCLIVSIAFTIKVWVSHCKNDIGFRLWEDNGIGCKITKYLVNTLSCFMFRFYRLIYSRLFGRVEFNAFYSRGNQLLIMTRNCTYASIALQSFPMVAVAAALLYMKKVRDQTYYNCIDVAITGTLSIILNIINCQKSLDYFEETREQLGIRQDYENVNSDDTSSISLEKSKKKKGDPSRKYRDSW
jgi:hypothetical protein